VKIRYILPVLLAAAAPVLAESQLSARGNGLQYYSSSVRASGMGLAALAAPDSLSLDLFSPANWGGRQAARFGFGSFVSQTTSSDAVGSDASDDGGVSGVGFAVHLKKGWYAGATLSPYTLLGYKWRSTDSLDWGTANIRRQGDGGISQALVGFSAPVGKGIRLGLAARPVFGKVERLWSVNFTETTANSASETISERYSGLGWSLSGSWSDGVGGAGIVIKTPLEAKIERQMVVGAGGSAQVDTTAKLDRKLELPFELTAGVSRRMGAHLYAGEVEWSGWGSVDNAAAGADQMDDAIRLSLGWEWSPDYQPLDPFWRNLVYRAGFWTASNYALSASDNQSRRTALTMGLGVPYAADRSRIDLAFEVGMAGDKADDGVAERYISFSVGFNHSELWFVGRKERNK